MTPTWEDGPWLVERRIRYRVSGCSADTARRAAAAYEANRPLPHGETMPDIQRMDVQTSIFPEGDVPFDIEASNEGDQP